TFTEHNLIFTPGGRETKRMIQAPQGLMGMTDAAEKVSFLKHSPYVRDGRYPMNCNLAFYNGPGNFMTEMESMGAESTLKPGETARNVETWALRDPVDWKKARSVRLYAAKERIPAAPRLAQGILMDSPCIRLAGAEVSRGASSP